MAAGAGAVREIRRFNRFYTPVIGTLSRGYLDTPHTLHEARILYEVATRPGCTAKDIRAVAGFDQGYLSRLVTRLEEKGLVTRRTSTSDGRAQELYLSSRGKKAFQELDRRADRQAGQLVDHLSAHERNVVADSLATVRRMLARADRPMEFSIRQGRTGDLGLCFQRQVTAYKEEFGFTNVFETYFSEGLPVFLKEFDPQRDRLWVAETDGVPVGWVAIHHTDEEPGRAKLRWFFVDREARGHGLGGRLVRTAVDFSRDAGYHGVFLWTVDILDSARRLYERAGFTLTEETDDCPWKDGVREQRWDLSLTGEA